MTWVELVRAVLVGLSVVASAGFCWSYHRWTGGHWRDTPHGVHLMVFSGVCALILLYSFLSITSLIPQAWRPFFSLVIYLSISVLFVWRWVLLRRDQRVETEPDPADEEEDSDYRNGWPPKA